MNLTVVLAVGTLVGLVLAFWYVRGLLELRRHPQGRRQQRWRPWALLLGVLVVIVLGVSPLGELLEQRLVTHMAQHVAFMMVAAPLLALAAPGAPLLAGMPAALRHRLVSAVRRVPHRLLLSAQFAWVLQAAVLWGWHMPAAYDAALRSEGVHLLEHACFLGAAWLFWWQLATRGARRLRGLPAMLYVAASIPPGAALGAVLTFASSPIYPAQAARAAASGLDPLLDQRLGGLVMWVPLDFAYVVLAMAMFARWLQREGPAGDAAGELVIPDLTAGAHR